MLELTTVKPEHVLVYYIDGIEHFIINVIAVINNIMTSKIDKSIR